MSCDGLSTKDFDWERVLTNGELCEVSRSKVS